MLPNGLSRREAEVDVEMEGDSGTGSMRPWQHWRRTIEDIERNSLGPVRLSTEPLISALFFAPPATFSPSRKKNNP